MAGVGGAGVGGPRKRRPEEGEAPDSHVAEEGKRVIKELVTRQTGTSISLDQQRAREREREFTRAAAVLPLRLRQGECAGAESLRAFTERANRVSRREELAGLGLLPGEARLLADHDEGVESLVRLTEPERLAREEKIRQIRRKVDEALRERERARGPAANSSSLSSSSSSSRHLRELTSAHGHSQLLELALREGLGQGEGEEEEDEGVRGARDAFREPAQPPAQHPVHRLRDLQERMFGSTSAPPSATSKKRRRLRQQMEDSKTQESTPVVVPVSVPASRPTPASRPGSLWDVADPDRVPEHPPPPAPPPSASASSASKPAGPDTRKRYGPQRPRQYTIRGGKIVELDPKQGSETEGEGGGGGERWNRGRGEDMFVVSGASHVPLEEIRSCRLSLEEIKQMPKFANYEAGLPSPVLYVKNLSDSVTADDLASVFGSFQTPGPCPGTSSSTSSSTSPSSRSLVLKLCSGRMRGQAFVTFPSVDEATRAREEVNGYRLKDRPMIVQFGKSKRPE